jgi:hypothetical protein
MKKILLSTFVAATFAVGSANAQLVTNNYAGNGNTGFGGAVGTGSLQIVNDNLGALNFTYTRGSSDFNNAIVIYFDSISGGATSTSGFTDTGDGLRKAMSGLDGANRSTLNFAGGFGADYAIALNNGFAGVWSLSDPANFPFVTSASLLPSPATQTETAYTFSLNVSNIGLTPGSGQSFSFFTTYISETAFRSTETFGAGFTGSPAQGYNTFDAAGNNSFTTVPEPSTYALLGLGALALGGYMARRRARK